MRVTNQKPQLLSPLVTQGVASDFDPMAQLTEMVARPLLTPLSSSGSAHITHKGQDLDENDIANLIGACLGDTIEPVAEVVAKNLLKQTMAHFPDDAILPVTNLFALQSATIAGLDEPDPQTIYLPATDVIPTSKGLITGTVDYDEWFASLAFYAQPDTLGFAFACEASFDAFKVWLAGEINMLASALPPETVRCFDSFQKSCTLDELTESMWLRKSANEGNEEYSFARMLPNLLTRYARDVAPNESWICPFSLDRLLIPESLVLINVEQHSRATARAIDAEWKLINDAIADDLRILRPGQVQKLTAARRNANKIARAAASAQGKKNEPATRAANVKFRKTPPTTVDIVRLVSKILSKLAYVNHSQNVYKSTKMSFARPNRRDPDDYNRQGKVVSTRYRPDIHLYVDTSGSISEAQYQDAVKACIALARKLDVNLYFNSFSHIMTTSVMLQTKGCSPKQIWRQVQKVPKVHGGTDYEQLWRYVAASKKRRRELSIIITDFEYYPPKHHVDHPRNIYYLPVSHVDWDRLVSAASSFSASMTHLCPDIRKHILI